MSSARALKHEPEAASSRQRILDAALHLLARHGYGGMSLQMLADEVGLHKATLFHHFTGKKELVREVFDDVIDRLLRHLEPLERDHPPTLDQLVAVAEQLADYFADEPEVARFLMRDLVTPPGSTMPLGAADPPPAVVRVFTIIWEWLDRASRGGVIRRVDVRHTIFDLLGAMLFYPAAAPGLKELSGRDPFSPRARRARKDDLAAFIHGALAPR